MQHAVGPEFIVLNSVGWFKLYCSKCTHHIFLFPISHWSKIRLYFWHCAIITSQGEITSSFFPGIFTGLEPHWLRKYTFLHINPALGFMMQNIFPGKFQGSSLHKYSCTFQYNLHINGQTCFFGGVVVRLSEWGVCRDGVLGGFCRTAKLYALHYLSVWVKAVILQSIFNSTFKSQLWPTGRWYHFQRHNNDMWLTYN